MGVVHWLHREKDRYRFRMKALLLVSVFLPALEAICAIQGCDKYWAANKNNREVTGACAVVFDENSCKGPQGLKNDITSLIVMPGCKLEIWDHESGLSNAESAEKKSFNDGNLRDNKDKYKQNKLEFEAQVTPLWVEDIDDDFDDLDDDVESFRCTCK